MRYVDPTFRDEILEKRSPIPRFMDEDIEKKRIVSNHGLLNISYLAFGAFLTFATPYIGESEVGGSSIDQKQVIPSGAMANDAIFGERRFPNINHSNLPERERLISASDLQMIRAGIEDIKAGRTRTLSMSELDSEIEI